MPPGWSGPTWYQVYGTEALADAALNVSTVSVPGGPYSGTGQIVDGRATWSYVPLVPVDTNPVETFAAMKLAVGAYGTVTQHAYLPVIVPLPEGVDRPEGPGAMSIGGGDLSCGWTEMPGGSEVLACVGRSDVIDVAQAAQDLALEIRPEG